ncbi:MAG: type II toxin-antitoxin system VapC family toxin [Planctomycetales bacterium]|nr:type II toxin-antitoxin system VapC family toxin [Planctomycetales bacterium]
MPTAPAAYVDTSAALRAILEKGTSPEIEAQLGAASVVVTSRLSLVESARAFLRVRVLGRVSETQLADAEREIGVLWARAYIWDLTPEICSVAMRIAPGRVLRALDALQLATFVVARGSTAGLSMLTADERLREAATTA